MRLPEKQEIDKQQNEERHRDIQEGAKLAKRIDELRRLESEEKARITKWRDSTLEITKQELKDSIHARDNMRTEIERLRLERDELLIPLDFKWSEIQKLENKLEKREHELSILEATLAEKSMLLEVREKEARVIEGRAEDAKRISSSMFSQAEAQMADAKSSADIMKNRAQAELNLIELQKLEIKKAKDELYHKETKIAEREQKIELYEIDLAKREQTLRAGWKNLEQTKLKLNL